MEGKVSQLAERLRKEGVEKGEEEKERIITEAQAKAADIMAQAQSQAEKIVAEAKQKADDAVKNAQSEIKLSGQQALSSLKSQITDMISVKATDGAISETLSKNIPEYIKALLQNWKGDDASIEVLLSPEQKDKLEKDITAAVKGILKGGLTVGASKNVKAGFQIGEAKGTFKVSFTDADFAEYFKEYLRPKVKSILFGE